MIEKRNLSEWAVNGFILACITIIALSLGVVGRTYFDQSWFTSVTIAIVGFAALYSLRQQSLLSRKLEQISFRNREISAYETEIERRFDLLSQEMRSSGSTSGFSRSERKKLNQNMKLVESLITGLQHRVSELEVPNEESSQPSTVRNGDNAAEFASMEIPLTEKNQPQNLELNENLGQASNVALLYPRADQRNETQSPGASRLPSSPPAGSLAPGTSVEDASGQSTIETDNLELHLQPIVELTTRKPEFYDAVLRMKSIDGQYLQPEQLAAQASRKNLMPQLDHKAIFGSVRMLRTLSDMNKKMKLFCNISALSFCDSASFEEIISFLEANVSLSSSLSFELPQSRYKQFTDEEKSRLAKIAELGFGLSLGQTLDLKFDAAALRQAGFSHVKVPASVLLNPNLSDDAEITPSELAFNLARSDLHLLASEIERESQVMNLIDFEVRYGQGDFFAPPRPVKPELLGSSTAAHDEAATRFAG